MYYLRPQVKLHTVQRETLARFLIWRFGEFSKGRQIKNFPILITACVPMALRIQIAKIEFHQYLLRANSPNLMLAKFSRYTVHDFRH